MGHFLSIVASAIVESRRTSFQRKLESQELSLQDLELMDEDGDGCVSRAEFLEFMLGESYWRTWEREIIPFCSTPNTRRLKIPTIVSMGKVDKELIDEMRQYFSKLDIDGSGKLSKEDLITKARQKLRRTSKKLQLASYKRNLLRRAQEASDSTMRRTRRPVVLFQSTLSLILSTTKHWKHCGGFLL